MDGVLRRHLHALKEQLKSLLPPSTEGKTAAGSTGSGSTAAATAKLKPTAAPFTPLTLVLPAPGSGVGDASPLGPCEAEGLA